MIGLDQMKELEKNSCLIDVVDNVAVVIEDIKEKQNIIYRNNQEMKVIAIENVPIYHKVAIKTIYQGEPIIKYGEPIGIASQLIEVGAHVHEHNVIGKKGKAEDVI